MIKGIYLQNTHSVAANYPRLPNVALNVILLNRPTSELSNFYSYQYINENILNERKSVKIFIEVYF